MRRPCIGVGDDENAVHMIWHHDSGIRFHMGKMGGDSLPQQARHSSEVVHPYRAVHDFAERRQPDSECKWSRNTRLVGCNRTLSAESNGDGAYPDGGATHPDGATMHRDVGAHQYSSLKVSHRLRRFLPATRPSPPPRLGCPPGFPPATAAAVACGSSA